MAGYNDPESGYTAGAAGFFTHLGHVTDITNKFDKDAAPVSGQVLAWNGSVYAPVTPVSGSTDPEVVRDTIAAALVAGPNVTVTPDDAADTIIIAATGGGTGGGDVEDPLDPGFFTTPSNPSVAWINVKDAAFGALGNGSANDTAAVQNAINAAGTNSIIYFPGGIYLIDTLTISSKTGLTIWAPAAVIKRTAAVTNHLFRIGETGACTNLKFNIFEIDGNNFIGSATTGTAFDIRNTTGLEINAYIHHTWNHGIRFTNTPSSNVKINIRAEFIGRGYTADNTFVSSTPHGCGIYCATAAPLTDADLAVTGTDIKGFGAIYIGGCTRLIARLNVKRLGYRGLYCGGGPGNVTRLTIPNPVIEDCGAVYESSITPGAAGYGEGTNAIYVGDSPVTAQDAFIVGAYIKRCGENAIEGKCIINGVTAEDLGYSTGSPYSSFDTGPGRAKEGIFVHSGSRLRHFTLINPGEYGVRRSDGVSMSDIQIEQGEVIGATLKGISLQQAVTGTSTGLIVRDVTIRKGGTSPTHGVHLAATGGASMDATCIIKDVVTHGTFSAAAVLKDATGGGTNSTNVSGTVSV